MRGELSRLAAMMSAGSMHEAMWSRSYREVGEAYLFGTEPNRYLKRHVGLLQGAVSILSVADGEGRNSVWLAGQGFKVTASEISPVALAKAKKLAETLEVQVDFQQDDLLTKTWPEASFDAVVAVFIQFMGPTEREGVFERLKSAVRPGGWMLVQGYTPKQLDYRTGGPPSLENLYTEPVLRGLLKGWEVLRLDEYEDVLEEGSGHNGRSALIGAVARKPL